MFLLTFYFVFFKGVKLEQCGELAWRKTGGSRRICAQNHAFHSDFQWTERCNRSGAAYQQGKKLVTWVSLWDLEIFCP